MELQRAIERRRMVRDFRRDVVDAELLSRVLANALRVPSAGHTQACELLVLEGESETTRYWDATLAPAQRATFPWPGLLHAPVLVVVWVEPGAYVRRYAEPDKARTGLGADADAWSVPYWWVDGGMAVQNLLLSAVDAGLGALFFGVFEHEDALRAACAVPSDRRAVGTVALGYPADEAVTGSAARRPRRDTHAAVHRGMW